MKKFGVQAIMLLIVITATLVFFNPTGQTPKIDLPFMPQTVVFQVVEINGSKIKVEVADTNSKKNKGLSGRDSLPTDQGMLFTYEKSGKYVFWMKGMKFSLDFIWINEGKVVDILENVSPPRQGQSDGDLAIYSSKEEFDKLIEVNAGVVRQLNIKVGDTVTLSQ